MFRLISWFPYLIIAISAMGCTDDQQTVDISKVEKSAHIKRFDRDFFNSDTAKMAGEVERLSQEYPEFFAAGTNLKFWKSQRTDPQQLELYKESTEVFGNFEKLEENLNFSMKHYYHYFPSTPEINFYSYISNLDFSFPVLYVPEQSVCFIALDLYLGPSKKYYRGIPQYMAYFRQPTFLVRDCIDAVAAPHIKRKTEAITLLDDMIYYGKRLYFLEKMLPQKDASVIAQYPPKKLQFCRDNERTIWAYFVENNHLFNTSEDLKRRFTELAPFSKFRMKFDSETPGMIGRWVGWQIVQDYMEKNPSVTLQQLGAEIDSRKILKLSSYKP